MLSISRLVSLGVYYIHRHRVILGSSRQNSEAPLVSVFRSPFPSLGYLFSRVSIPDRISLSDRSRQSGLGTR